MCFGLSHFLQRKVILPQKKSVAEKQIGKNFFSFADCKHDLKMSSLQACSQQQLTTLLLNSPVSAASWAPTLCRCFAFERSAAALLMYNTSQAGPHTAVTRPQLTPSTSPQHPSSNNLPHAPHHTALGLNPCEPTQSDSDGAASSPPPEPVARECSETSAGDPDDRTQAGGAHAGRTQAGRTYPSKQASAAAGASDESDGRVELATVVLPRMPLGLKHITSSTAYTAVANVARALGRCSMAAGRESPAHSGWQLAPVTAVVKSTHTLANPLPCGVCMRY